MSSPSTLVTPIRRYVPPGGFTWNGTVLTRDELTCAIAWYARHHCLYARTVRAVTALKHAAVAEYLNRR